MAMKRRRNSLRATIFITGSCSLPHCFQSAARANEHRIHQFAGQLVAGDRWANRRFEPAASRVFEANAERLQRVTNAVFDVEKFALQIATVEGACGNKSRS
jgi:hypothetical protein